MSDDTVTLFRATGTVWSSRKDEELVYEVVRTSKEKALDDLLDELHHLREYDTGSETVEEIVRYDAKVDLVGLLSTFQANGHIESKEVVYDRH